MDKIDTIDKIISREDLERFLLTLRIIVQNSSRCTQILFLLSLILVCMVILFRHILLYSCYYFIIIFVIIYLHINYLNIDNCVTVI
jgi:hypothetical protein